MKPITDEERDFLVRTEFEALLYEDSSDEEDVQEKTNSDLPSDSHYPASRNNANPSNSETSTVPSENVILSMIWQNELLGAAYYNVSNSELFIMNDVIDNSIFEKVKALYKQVNPNCLITVSGLAENFVGILKNLTIRENLEATEGETEENCCSLKILSKADNTFDYCFARVQNLKLEGEPLNANFEERNAYLSSFINFNSRGYIYALGLLLKYLDREWHRISTCESEQALFLNITNVSLGDLMMMDEDCYRSLNIITTRDHPSFFKFGNDGIKKHTISLYSLFNNCQSRLGAQALWKIMHHPTTDIGVLKKRHQVIEFFLNPANQSVVDGLKSCLRYIYRLSPLIINKISISQAKYVDWRKLDQTISNVIQIVEICGQYRNEVELFDELVESVTQTTYLVKYFIDLLVDFEMSQVKNQFALNTGVDTLYDELAHICDNLPRTLNDWGAKDIPNLPESVESWLMVYIPNIQYLLAITQWKNGPPNDPQIPGLEYKFTIENVHHYKSPAAKELDEKLGDVKVKLAKRQNTIMMKLVKFIVRHYQEIITAIRLCSELDVMLSFFMVARDSNYVQPEIVESRIIEIKQGRHPLKESFVTNFVPNDVYSGDGYSLVKILTGPNSCGKSVYLKQIALIVFMAHIGSYVPADFATIGIVSRITAQIISTNSISLLNASTFLQDIRQINIAVHSATGNSLVIIDEFGRGTSEIDGAALLASVCKYFLDLGTECPQLFIATHLHRVFDLIPKGPLIQPQTFDFLQPTDEREIVFLFKLIEGVSKLSFAHAVAKHAGLNSDILKRATEIYNNQKQNKLTSLEKPSRKNMGHLIVQRIFNSMSTINLEDLKVWAMDTVGCTEQQFRDDSSKSSSSSNGGTK